MDDVTQPLLPAPVQSQTAQTNASQNIPQPLNPTQQQQSAVHATPAAASIMNKGKVDGPRAPKRTTKTAQKLTLFPEDAVTAGDDVVGNLDAQADATLQLPHVTAKTQKEQWLSKMEKKWLPRVTAYCTANSYKFDALFDWLKSRSARNYTAPKKFDEVIYTPWTSTASSNPAPPHLPQTGPPHHHHSFTDLIEWSNPGEIDASLQPLNDLDSFFEQNVDASGRTLPSNISFPGLAKRISPIGECMFFDYGVVVMWGLSEAEEEEILKELAGFEEEKLAEDDVEVENFHFHYNTQFQPRIYNDIITLKNPANYMIKLTISHAIAQSVKLALFEGLIETTIESTKHIPQIMAETGKIQMSRKAINKKIGQLFIMRINVNLVSNVLDIPEIFWSEPALEPLYMAIRGYLEISQRVDLLNQRVSVISDLLDMLKEHMTSSHGEQLEWIVIILIAFEIIIGIGTMSFDLIAYLQEKSAMQTVQAFASQLPAVTLPALGQL
ncbi:hypothetical protein HK097_002172 [Rhizophlyctis rosea]|uniref:DUF155 domain-containing protein n=1 Tax=Rhizophlyctis rosea TaxID=64517 RepID=A0AAD5SGJ9_9FUNG|nr:hypothetical protein HK097_002172 [Rhizophlyctis rosea]